jgi:hypothetical protein
LQTIVDPGGAMAARDDVRAWDKALLQVTMGDTAAHVPTIACLRVLVDRSAPEFQVWW